MQTLQIPRNLTLTHPSKNLIPQLREKVDIEIQRNHTHALTNPQSQSTCVEVGQFFVIYHAKIAMSLQHRDSL